MSNVIESTVDPMPEPYVVLDPINFRRMGKTNLMTELFVAQLEKLTGNEATAYRDHQFLEDLRHKLNTQDNWGTQDVLFVIYNKRRRYVSDDLSDLPSEWVDTDDCCLVDEKTTKILERYVRRYDRSPDGYEKRGYIEVDEFVTCMFTEAAANEYIERNKHRLHDPHIAGDTLYRNEEMKRLRNILRGSNGN